MAGWVAQEGGRSRRCSARSRTRALWVILGVSLVALLFAWYLVREVFAAPEGTDKMKEIAKAIQEGASAYLSRQFRTVGVFLIVLAVVHLLRPAGAEGRGPLGDLDPARPLGRVHPGRGVLGDHGLHRHVARRPRERADRERRP